MYRSGSMGLPATLRKHQLHYWHCAQEGSCNRMPAFMERDAELACVRLRCRGRHMCQHPSGIKTATCPACGRPGRSQLRIDHGWRLACERAHQLLQLCVVCQHAGDHVPNLCERWTSEFCVVVKAARAQNCGIEIPGVVASADEQHAFCPHQRIHLCEELIDDLAPVIAVVLIS